MPSVASKTRSRKPSTINGYRLHDVRPPQLAASLFLSEPQARCRLLGRRVSTDPCLDWSLMARNGLARAFRRGPLLRADRKYKSMTTSPRGGPRLTNMEPHLCNVVSMSRIAAQRFDDEDQGLLIFATSHLDDMLQKSMSRYYAEDFPWT